MIAAGPIQGDHCAPAPGVAQAAGTELGPTAAGSTNPAASQGQAVGATAPPVVALVGPLPPPSAGMANQTWQLQRLLEDEGSRVRLVRTNPDYRPAWVGRVRVMRALFRLLPYLRALWRDLAGADVVHVMANSGWAWHVFAAPAVWIGTLRGVPVVVNYRGGDAAAFLDAQAGWIRPTLKRAAVVVVPSGFLHEVFARHGVATTVVPNVVDLNAFAPSAAPARSPHVIVTRNLEPIYDCASALRAFARLLQRYPAARMTVAGEGSERARLEQLASTLGAGASITFTGRLDNTALPALVASATVALNPSRIDNTPISVLEALASGIPVVSTRVGGVPFLVRDGETALLVPPGDVEAMAAALCRVHDDPALARRLAAAGRAHASRFAWNAVRPQLFAVYARAVGARP